MILGKKWMQAILNLQKEIFQINQIKYSTVLQSNLTLLDQEWIELLKENNVEIGTSLDLFAKTRPFKNNNKNSASVVIDKLIMLAENNLNASAIVVISSHNHKKGKEIYEIMNEIGLDFHTLPLDADSIKYCPELEISPGNYAQCLVDIAEEYLGPRNRIEITNLDGYIDLIKFGYPSRRGICSVSRNCCSTRLFFENTGDVYFCGSFCKPEILLGNVFNDSIGRLFSRLANKNVYKRLAHRYENIKKACKGCEFLSICNGGCPAFAYDEGDMFSKSDFWCAVNKIFFSHLKKKFAHSKN